MNQFMFISLVHSSELQALKELLTAQVRQILRESIAISLKSKKHKRVDHMLCRAIHSKKLIVGNVNGANYIQKALDTKIVNSSLARALSQRTLFEGKTFFHLAMFIEYCIVKKLLSLASRYFTRTPSGFSVQHILTAWGICTSQLLLGSVQSALQTYIQYKFSTGRWKVIDSHKHGMDGIPSAPGFLPCTLPLSPAPMVVILFHRLHWTEGCDVRGTKIPVHSNIQCNVQLAGK